MSDPENCARVSSFRPTRRTGFTLIELLVVIGIIGLLVSILVPVLAVAKKRASYAGWQSYSHQLCLSQELGVYFNMQTRDDGTGRLPNASYIITEGRQIDPPNSDGQFYTQAGSYFQSSEATVAPMWVNGRWVGKPAVQFGTGNNTMVSNYSGNLQDFGAQLTNAQQVTVSMWINMPVQSQNSTILNWCNSSGSNMLSVKVPSAGSIQWDAGGTTVDSLVAQFPTVNANSWTHFVFTKDMYNGANIQKIYMNGSLVASVTGTVNLGPQVDNTTPTDVGYSEKSLILGKRPGGSFWQGSIDEVGIWGRTLDDQEIATMFKAGSYF